MRLLWDLWTCIGCKALSRGFRNGGLAKEVGALCLATGQVSAGGCRMQTKSLPESRLNSALGPGLC